MKPVRFCRIAFRSASHLVWFQSSIFLFAVSWIWYLTMRIFLGEQKDTVFAAIAIWIAFLCHCPIPCIRYGGKKPPRGAPGEWRRVVCRLYLV